MVPTKATCCEITVYCRPIPISSHIYSVLHTHSNIISHLQCTVYQFRYHLMFAVYCIPIPISYHVAVYCMPIPISSHIYSALHTHSDIISQLQCTAYTFRYHFTITVYCIPIPISSHISVYCIPIPISSHISMN